MDHERTQLISTESDLSPRERRHQRTQQAILEAARAIVHEQGAEKLSIRAIADRIDYSPAGLYEYFGSKEEIIQAVCQQGQLKLKHYLAAVEMTLPFDDHLAELGMAYIRFAVQNPDYFLLMFNTLSASLYAGQEGQTPLKHFPSGGMMDESSSFPLLLAAVQRGLDEGHIQQRPGFGVLEIAYSVWALVHGIAMLRITHLRDFALDFDVMDRQALEAIGRGLRSEPSVD
jgi:AcrR family transcriptional regulator